MVKPGHIIIQNGSEQTYDGGSGTDTLKVDTSGGWLAPLIKLSRSIEINMTTGIVGQTNNPNKEKHQYREYYIYRKFDTYYGDGNDNIIIGDTGNDTMMEVMGMIL